ncbi:hypothetical protein MS3_00003701 [Schistosoma haematobium]|uniref:Uncharacterized protein n=1 Tax=Schistosoma haematobium TaxID=6185 RepID=A0A6A5DFH4_SCHHA|nr:hypothetical protein MS3_00003701 [Schistosoma haematobium]KAH9591411.1 hypothetical protein MS3_00003701 [Schistosoma haematobium]CAH8675005.1 unnamed protein product [Schistosoma haematobium]
MDDKRPDTGRVNTKCKYIMLLMIMTVTLYLSIELCLFTSDQYVFYNAVTEQGLPYLTRQERHKYANLSVDDKIKLRAAQKKAATLESTTNAVRITLGLISMLIIGYISDRHGRRVAIGILLFGEFLHITTVSLIVTFNLNVWILLLAGFFEAFFGGGLLSIYAQVAAIVVDIIRISHAKKDLTVTTEKISHDTWIWFTVFESIALLCSSSGSPIGGTLIYQFGFKAVIITGASLFVPSLIILCIFPETNNTYGSPINVEDNKDNDSNNVQTIEIQPEWKEKFIMRIKSVGHLDPILIVIIIIIVLLAIGAMADLHYIVIYLMGSPFLWNPQQVGIYIGLSDFISSVLGITYTIIVVKIRERKSIKQKLETNGNHTSQEEHKNDKSRIVFLRNMRLLIFTLAGTLLLMIINKIMMGIAHQFTQQTASTIAYMAVIPRLSKSFISPVARSMFALCTPPNNQGMIQSFGGFVARIGFVISFISLPAVYAVTVTIFPPIVFLVVSGILLLTIIIDLSLLPLLKTSKVHH